MKQGVEVIMLPKPFGAEVFASLVNAHVDGTYEGLRRQWGKYAAEKAMVSLGPIYLDCTVLDTVVLESLDARLDGVHWVLDYVSNTLSSNRWRLLAATQMARPLPAAAASSVRNCLYTEFGP